MSQAVKLSKLQWLKLREKLIQDYPRSVILLRWKMLEVLGFTVRHHEEWVDRNVESRDFGYGTKYRQETIHLDFYNEPKRTMFLLKYSEYLQK
jgi:hypothetical protein